MKTTKLNYVRTFRPPNNANMALNANLPTGRGNCRGKKSKINHIKLLNAIIFSNRAFVPTALAVISNMIINTHPVRELIKTTSPKDFTISSSMSGLATLDRLHLPQLLLQPQLVLPLLPLWLRVGWPSFKILPKKIKNNFN